jgi:hypothetical protein
MVGINLAARWVAPDPLMVGIRSPDGLVVGSVCEQGATLC